MADKDFVVKNGLVVNPNTSNPGFVANSTQFTLSTINTSSNGILANSTAIVFGNTLVYTTINTTGVSNAFRLGGVLASSYLTSIPSYGVNTSGNFTVAGNLNFTGTNVYFSAQTYVTANLVVNGAIFASGSSGDVGQVLTSNGTSNVYWKTISIPGGGLTGIDGVGNVAYDSSRLGGQLPSYYTNASNITTGTLPNTRIGSAYVNTSANFTVAGNLDFTGTNVYFTTAHFAPAGIYFGANATANVFLNSSRLSVGNSTINTSVNTTAFYIANTLSTVLITSGSISAGNTTTTAGFNAISGYSKTGSGVYGFSNTSTGVQGLSPYSGYGVYGESNTGAGVGGTSISNFGVVGLSNTNYGVYAVSNTGTGLYVQSNTGTVASFANATDNFARIVSNGNIGFGTTAPDYKLTVNGSIRSIGLKTYELATPTGVLTTTGSGSLAAAVYYIRVVAVDALGGLTEPSSEVSRTSSASGSILVQFDAVPGAIKYRVYFKAGSTPTDTYFETTTNSYNLTTVSGASSRTIPTYNTTGAVNIGAYSNTDYKLTIQNNANTGGQFLIYNSNTGTGTAVGFDMIHAAYAGSSQIYHNSIGKLVLKGGAISFETGQYSGTERMYLTSTGLTINQSLTVGTLGFSYVGPAIQSYCQTQNSVFGQSYGGIGVVGQSNTNVGVYGKSNTAWGGYFESNTGAPLYVGNTGGTEFLRVAANGNIGIKTTSPKAPITITPDIFNEAGTYTPNKIRLFDDGANNVYGLGISGGSLDIIAASQIKFHNISQASNVVYNTAFIQPQPYLSAVSLSGVVCTASPGAFSCNPATIGNGNWIKVTGTPTSTGTMGPGYVSGTYYRAIIMSGSSPNITTFGIVTTDGYSVMTTTGPMTGLTFTLSDAGPNPAASATVYSGAVFGVVGEIRATQDITAYYSDRRLKENVVGISNAVEKVNSLNGIVYNPNDLAVSFGYDKTTKLVGLFADEVEAVLPEAVRRAPFDQDEFGNSKSGENYKTIQYEKIVPLLIEAIKELKAEIEQLKGSK